MYKKGILLLSFLFTSTAYALDSAEFENIFQLMKDKELAKVESFLDRNETKLNTDPDYYVLLINYAVQKSINNHIVVAQGKPKGGDIALLSEETGEQAGFIGERTEVNMSLFNKTISDTNKALLQHFPERLDIHFGLVILASQAQQWKAVSTQLVTTNRCCSS